jgi:hypothetical protein
MATFQVIFDVEKAGFPQDLQTMMQRVSDEGLRFFLADEVDPYLQDRIDQRFINEGDDAVGKWLPLSTATEAIRQASGFGGAHPINERYGDMHNFLTGEHGEATAFAGGAELVFPGPGVDPLNATKIETAQIGKAFPPTPPRPVVALSPVDEEDVLNDLTDYILRDTMSIVGVRRI